MKPPLRPADSGISKLARRQFAVADYRLGDTLNSGQAFRWTADGSGWSSVIRGRWVHLEQSSDGIVAEAVFDTENWDWLTDYLQLETDLPQVISSFPKDPSMREAVEQWRGLRLLRQEPWECLASFLMSSTKQIVQIRQIVEQLCTQFGEPVPAPRMGKVMHAFPTAERLAECSEAELRVCKMGFRAPYLRGSAQRVAGGRTSLEALHQLPTAAAREALMELPGVGRKIADCVLLFAYGRQDAFPVDVWIMKALREAYFPRRQPSRQRLEKFTATYFGPNAGYAQQYLFHHWRTRSGARNRNEKTGKRS